MNRVLYFGGLDPLTRRDNFEGGDDMETGTFGTPPLQEGLVQSWRLPSSTTGRTQRLHSARGGRVSSPPRDVTTDNWMRVGDSAYC